MFSFEIIYQTTVGEGLFLEIHTEEKEFYLLEQILCHFPPQLSLLDA